ncbi:MAG: folylpolyglutamate synthase/dihydrofolate synthase family protein [Bacillota bacterium]|nr:folylpolyglutamate synthase/dihydrofolate synthase family protein [Bacillota bacterium]
MTYEQAITTIHSQPRFSPKPGLERIKKLLNYFGNPQDKLKFIHVAGTNGKGSTCTLIASVLSAAGYKTGLYTSPFIVDFRERIQINKELIPKDELACLLEEMLSKICEMAQNGENIIEFELITAMAFLWFSRQNCDIVVLETGLGGRFDSTNVITTPETSVITSISLDHMDILGDTIEKIAFEKAGIIKHNGNTVFFRQEECVNQIIKQTAFAKENSLYFADEIMLEILEKSLNGTLLRYKNNELFLPFLGMHQIKNAKTAIKALEVLRNNGYKISDFSLTDGFKKAKIPARMEVLMQDPLVLLDGAHNEGGMLALKSVINDYLDGKKVFGFVGMLNDKDVSSSLKVIERLFDTLIITETDNPRKMCCDALFKLALPLFENVICDSNPSSAFKQALQMAKESNGAVVVFGSLYLAAEIRSLFFY